MSTTRTHIVIPKDLSDEIETLVGKRGKSAFFAEAARKELRRLRMLSALERAAGSWKAARHPELQGGSQRWVRQLRRESERRVRSVTAPSPNK